MATERQPGTDHTPTDPVAERLISTALAQIRSEGMTVGLENIALERVIKEAGVARATAYRRWPNKADFLAEVLVRAVRETRLEAESAEDIAQLRNLLSDPERMRTEQGRRDIVVEGLRLATDSDVARMATSPSWRTYVAICATCSGLPEGTLRDTVTAALAEADRDFLARRAEVYSRLPALIGYRLVPPLTAPHGFEVMSAAAGAMMTGLIVQLLARPELLTETQDLALFGSSRPAPWSMPTRALVGLFLSHLEPDPAVVWDEARVAASLELMRAVEALIEQARGS